MEGGLPETRDTGVGGRSNKYYSTIDSLVFYSPLIRTDQLCAIMTDSHNLSRVIRLENRYQAPVASYVVSIPLHLACIALPCQKPFPYYPLPAVPVRIG